MSFARVALAILVVASALTPLESHAQQGGGPPGGGPPGGGPPGGGPPGGGPPGGGGGGGQVQIGSLDDISLGTWRGGGNLEDEDAHCVLGGKPNGVFRLTASGSGGGGAFELANGNETLPYEVYYNDGGGYVQVDANVPEGGLQGVRRNKDFDDCRQLGTGREIVRVRITETDLGRAVAGRYSGVLTLEVEPQ